MVFPSFNNRENMTIGGLCQRVLVTNRTFKAASIDFRKQEWQCSITSKLNSTFGMIGKAMADKMTQAYPLKN